MEPMNYTVCGEILFNIFFFLYFFKITKNINCNAIEGVIINTLENFTPLFQNVVNNII